MTAIPELPSTPGGFDRWMKFLCNARLHPEPGLSDAQFRVLTYVGVGTAAQGRAIPTVEQLLPSCGGMAAAEVQAQLDALADQGWLRQSA